MSRFLIFAALLLCVAGCTGNQRAKHLGGSYAIDLPCGRKLAFATWKGNNLWYAHRPVRTGEVPETTVMQEDSDYGAMKGKVVFKECAE
ncbi:MAG: hypothetical protein WC505_06325 [Patescibacteria group bacterium]